MREFVVMQENVHVCLYTEDMQWMCVFFYSVDMHTVHAACVLVHSAEMGMLAYGFFSVCVFTYKKRITGGKKTFEGPR